MWVQAEAGGDGKAAQGPSPPRQDTGDRASRQDLEPGAPGAGAAGLLVTDAPAADLSGTVLWPPHWSLSALPRGVVVKQHRAAVAPGSIQAEGRWAGSKVVSKLL